MKALSLSLVTVVFFLVGVLLPAISAGQTISAGVGHSLFICSDSTVMACGWNGSGQLGDGSLDNSTVPVQVSGISGIIAVAGGQQFSLALKRDGTVWAWGDNSVGQLGIGNNIPQLTPVPVSGLNNVVAIATRYSHSLALKNDGTVWAWGYNEFGQLGDSTTVNSSVPIQVHMLSGITAISAGQLHSLALRNDSTIWAWGRNIYGQLGINSTRNDSVPQIVNGSIQAIAIAAGGFHSLALKDDGTVWAWGYNGWGQLGNGSLLDDSIPAAVVGLPIIRSIAAGFGHSLAITSNGAAWTWGMNDLGQLGIGSLGNVSIPTQLTDINGIAEYSGGAGHSLARQNDGTVSASGANMTGALGDGTFTERHSFTHVVGLCPAYAAAPDPIFTGYFRPTASGLHQWIAGELSSSLPLPNGKTMWLFGRSHVDSIDANLSIPCMRRSVDNCILLQDGTVLSNLTTYLDTAGSLDRRSFFKLSATDSTVLTPGHGYVDGDTAVIFLSRFDSSGVFLGNYSGRVGITTMDLMDITRCYTHPSINFGKSVLTDADYVYLYGSRVDSNSIRRPYVARRSLVNASAAWQYYAGPGWTTDVALARPISPYEVSERFSVIRLQGGYFLVTQNKAPDPPTCGIQRNILVYRSDTITGMFSEPALLYTTDNEYLNLPIQTFNAYAHPAGATCDSMLLSYNVQDPGDTVGVTVCPSQCWTGSRQNADTWRPQFIRVPYRLIDSTISSLTVASFTATSMGNLTWAFTNTSSSASGYLWDFGDGVTSTLQHPTHTYANGGIYTVTLTAFGCGSSVSSAPFVSSPDPDFPFPSLAVFPNPSDGQLRINAQDLGQGAVTIELHTVVGDRILREVHQPMGGRLDVWIDLKVPNGIYLLRFGNGTEVVTRKVVVQ